jgi:hypothetical protein
MRRAGFGARRRDPTEGEDFFQGDRRIRWMNAI